MNYNCNNNCNPNTSFNITANRLCPSANSQFKIKFEFFFKSEYLRIFESQNHTARFFLREYSSTENTSVDVAVDESFSSEDVAEAVVEAAGDRLVHEDLVKLLDFVWLHVNSFSPTKTLATFKVDLHLRFEIRIEHKHAPVLDSSIALLERYEVDGRVKEEEERRCCICLEELRHGDGGGAMRMPCSHVFHGGCIRKWLTTSHSCPLCRYEMPSQ